MQDRSLDTFMLIFVGLLIYLGAAMLQSQERISFNALQKVSHSKSSNRSGTELIVSDQATGTAVTNYRKLKVDYQGLASPADQPRSLAFQ